MADRYFTEELSGEIAVLRGAEAHHLAHVLRARLGDEVVLFDGSGVECPARVQRLGRSEVHLQILSRETVDRELPMPLVLGVALPKGDRQRWLVEKAVELGVCRLAPLDTARGVAQPVESALVRLRRAVIEASKQCGRNRLMEVAAAHGWSEFLAAAPDGACRLIAHPGGNRLRSIVEMARSNTAGIWLAIGPEGGFTDQELAPATVAGWQPVDLGPRILRIETAAVLLAGLAAAAIDGGQFPREAGSI
jgi:16S rRNA (uracil1498-N3)-methyltransferase